MFKKFNEIFNFHTISRPCNTFLLLFLVALFWVGNPYISLIIIVVYFIFYIWYYIRPVINERFFLGFHGFIATLFIFVESNFLILFLFAIKLLFFLLIINIFIIIYNKKMVDFLKKLLILLGFYMLLVVIYVSIIKIYFLDAINILALASESSVVFGRAPSNIFLSFKNMHIFNSYQAFLFEIDFSNDHQLNDLVVQLSKFDRTKGLFFYVTQMILLSNVCHLNLVFIIN